MADRANAIRLNLQVYILAKKYLNAELEVYAGQKFRRLLSFHSRNCCEVWKRVLMPCTHLLYEHTGPGHKLRTWFVEYTGSNPDSLASKKVGNVSFKEWLITEPEFTTDLLFQASQTVNQRCGHCYVSYFTDISDVRNTFVCNDCRKTSSMVYSTAELAFETL